jgi:coproporphyrinogen III oxidase
MLILECTQNEARGLSGLFFDYCKTEEMKMEDWYNFVTEVGNFLQAYSSI